MIGPSLNPIESSLQAVPNPADAVTTDKVAAVESSIAEPTVATEQVDDIYPIAVAAAIAADERQGGDIVCLNVQGISVLADYFLVITAYSNTQVRAIVGAIEDRLQTEFDLLPRRVEGLQAGTWVLMDYADIIIHIQLESEREFYNLEAFWGHAPLVNLPLAG